MMIYNRNLMIPVEDIRAKSNMSIMYKSVKYAMLKLVKVLITIMKI